MLDQALGVPLDPDHECAVHRLEALDRPVAGATCHGEPVSELGHRLVVAGVDLDPPAAQSLAQAARAGQRHPAKLIHAPEVLDENRFLAARDGMNADLIDPVAEQRVPARALLADLLAAGLPHAEELGCADAFGALADLAGESGAQWQRSIAASRSLPHVVAALAARFSPS